MGCWVGCKIVSKSVNQIIADAETYNTQLKKVKTLNTLQSLIETPLQQRQPQRLNLYTSFAEFVESLIERTLTTHIEP